MHAYRSMGKTERQAYILQMAKFNGKKESNANHPPQSGFLVFLDDFGKDNKDEPKNILTAGKRALF